MRSRVLLGAFGFACALGALGGPARAMAEPPARPAPPPPGLAIRVLGISGDTVLLLHPTEAGGMVSVAVMARLLGGSLDSIGRGRWRLSLYGTALELEDGAPFAAYNGFTLPLIEPTRRVDDSVYVTLQLFSEIIPRFGIGILWDRTRWEVRLFQSIARRAAPAVDPLQPTVVSTPVLTAVTTASTPPVMTNTAAATAPIGSPVATTTIPNKPAPATGASRAPAGLSRRYTVVVDAGHGGRDPGMRGAMVGGRTVTEARITLEVAKRIESLLRAKGIDVLMTRRVDTLIALDDRGPIANRAKGDLFVSVHVNSANPRWKSPTAVRGFETFYLSTARTEDEQHVAEMENSVVRFETGADAPRGDPLSFIINDMARNEHLRESSDLAGVMQRQLGAVHPGPDRGVKQGGLVVLATAYMPAVLVEIGFGTNPVEARWMMSERGQADAARAIANGAFEYLVHYDRRARASQR